MFEELEPTYDVSEIYPPDIPTRANKSWTSEEEKKMLDAIQNGKTVHEISVEHARTHGAIHARQKRVARRMHHAGSTAEEISAITGLDIVEVEKQIEQHKLPTQKEKKEKNKCEKVKSFMLVHSGKVDISTAYKALPNDAPEEAAGVPAIIATFAKMESASALKTAIEKHNPAQAGRLFIYESDD